MTAGAALGSLLMSVLAVVQTAVLTRTTFLDGSPALVLLACVSWALAGRASEALVWAFFGGLALDLFSGAPFATSSIALIAAVYLASLTEGRFWEAHPLAPLGVMAVCSAVYHGLTLLAVWLGGQPVDFSLALGRVVLPGVLLNVLFSLPTAQLAERVREAVFPSPLSMG